MTRYIARENIPFGGVLAYTRGQGVESDAVEANGWQEFVVSESSKEGRQIKADITGRPVEEFEPGGGTTTTSRRAAASSTAQEG